MSQGCSERMYDFVKSVSEAKAEIVRTLNSLALLNLK